jgi:hypothetical protein
LLAVGHGAVKVMGIRFYCPQGHKLNVKEFQAGRKGICPFCGVKLQIPLQSTRPSSRKRGTDDSGAADDDAPDAARTIQEQAEQAGVAAAVPEPEQTAAIDPLVEAGSAVWYVRPAGGGQFGPASADIMRVWLAEGRLAADTYVWREGWRDWQLAGGVFPQLAPGPVVPGLEYIAPQPVASAPVHRPPAKANPDARLLIVGSLVAIVVVLLIIFVIVMSR